MGTHWGIKELVNMTYEYMNVKEIRNTCHFRMT